MARPTPSGKTPTPPGKRTRIQTLDIIIVILGIVFIIGYNRLSIARLQRSLPNANSQIVGEWKSTRGSEHLVFRADKSVSLTIEPAAGQAAAAPAAPQTAEAAAPPTESEVAPPAEGTTPPPDAAAPATPAPAAAAPVVGKYQLSEAGKVFVELSNGKKYSTTIKPDNKNRFDLIDSYTDGVTTFEREHQP